MGKFVVAVVAVGMICSLASCMGPRFSMYNWGAGPGAPSAIHEAARTGDAGKVKALLQDNPDLVSSHNDRDWAFSLWEATGGQHANFSQGTERVRLSYDMDLYARMNGGLTPLHVAAKVGNKDVVEVLLAYKPDVNDRCCGFTPLHLAAENGHQDIVEILRQYGGHE